MDREEFEYLRDLPDKFIEGNIVLQKTKESAPLVGTTVFIQTPSGDETAKLRIEWNEQTDAKTLNVWIQGIGPICRLDIDSKPHRPYGRNHKHSLSQPDCPHPSNNLSRDIVSRDDLAGKGIKEILQIFVKKLVLYIRATLLLHLRCKRFGCSPLSK